MRQVLRLACALAVAVALCAVPSTAAAQAVSGTLLGNITDSTGGAVPGREWPRVRGAAFGQRHTHPVDVGERQDLVAEPGLDRVDCDAVLLQPGPPPGQTAGGYFQTHFDRQTVAHLRRGHVRPGEKRQVRSGVTFRIGVEEVVRAGIVLVDAPFDQAHPENPGVKVEVLLRRPGNGGDVVKAMHLGYGFHLIKSLTPTD